MSRVRFKTSRSQIRMHVSRKMRDRLPKRLRDLSLRHQRPTGKLVGSRKTPSPLYRRYHGVDVTVVHSHLEVAYPVLFGVGHNAGGIVKS